MQNTQKYPEDIIKSILLQYCATTYTLHQVGVGTNAAK